MPFVWETTETENAITTAEGPGLRSVRNKGNTEMHGMEMASQQANDTATHIESVQSEAAIGKPADTTAMEGVQYTSRPPSPPSSGTTTPTLRLAPCPMRLRPVIPPPNYGVIKTGALYRSAFPQDRNVEFLNGLGVKTALCLVDTEPCEGYSQWVKHGGIKRHRVDILANKEGKVRTTWDSLCEALMLVMDCANYPMYIHCNQGRHRSGCVVACLRKVQRWPIEDILAEYETYANPKARPGDIELIRNFDPECVYKYAKEKGYFESQQPYMRRMDSGITNVDMLIEALSSNAPPDDLGVDISGISNMSNASTISDDGLEMSRPVPDLPMRTNGDATPLNPGETIVPLFKPPQRNQGMEITQDSIDIDSGEITAIDEEPEVEAEATTTVVELADDALMSPPAAPIPNPLM